MLCGLPVVSFNIGVAPDLIIHRRTGYLATLRDAADLANGIKTLITMDHSGYTGMRQVCRTMGLEKCSIGRESDSIINLINNVRISKIS
jgi:glycosyltransferase involved in cell wall biosynthesis